MDKKIGIMSMQRIINYGSFLQAYGLKKMIESVSKSEVEFIDYRFGVDITNRLKKPQSKAESIVDKILKNRTPWNYLKKKNFFKEIERNLILDLKDVEELDQWMKVWFEVQWNQVLAIVKSITQMLCEVLIICSFLVMKMEMTITSNFFKYFE